MADKVRCKRCGADWDSWVLRDAWNESQTAAFLEGKGCPACLGLAKWADLRQDPGRTERISPDQQNASTSRGPVEKVRCKRCGKEWDDWVVRFGWTVNQARAFWAGEGCPRCLGPKEWTKLELGSKKPHADRGAEQEATPKKRKPAGVKAFWFGIGLIVEAFLFQWAHPQSLWEALFNLIVLVLLIGGALYYGYIGLRDRESPGLAGFGLAIGILGLIDFLWGVTIAVRLAKLLI